MSMRVYRDHTGVEWNVWRVKPSAAAGITDRARQVAAFGDEANGPRRATGVRPGFERGWLAFESRNERFRVTPVPDAWETLTDEALDALRVHGTRVRPLRRLIE